MARSIPVPQPPLGDDSVALRPWAEHDWPLLVTGWQDPDVAAWTSPPDAPTEATARHWISGQDVRRARWLALDLVICARGDGLVVGEIGLSSFAADKTVEIGYWLLPEGRGRGLATAAVCLLTNWVNKSMPSLTIVAEVEADNAASASVMRRSGFQLDPTAQTVPSRWSWPPATDRADC